MSQYPNSPYSTPQPSQYGYSDDPYGAYLAPARRAGVLMFILGGISLACSLCLGLVTALAPIEQMIAQSGMKIPPASEIGMSADTFLRVLYGVMAGASLIIAVLLLILGIFVRRGSVLAIISTIVVDSLILIVLMLNGLAALAQLARAPANAIVGLAIVVLMASAFGLLLVWLIQALKFGRALRAAQLHYQQQYAQYQQYQQVYGYGYAQQQVQAPPAGNRDEPPTSH